MPRGRVNGGNRTFGSRGRTNVYVNNRYYTRPYRSYYSPGFSVGLGYYSPYYSYGVGNLYSPYYGAYNDPYYGYGYGNSYGYYGSAGNVAADYVASGWLRLKVRPRHADVFVDGYYVGIVDEFDGAFQRLRLEAGPHQVEVAAEGFAPLTFDVRILPNRKTVFEQQLLPLP